MIAIAIQRTLVKKLTRIPARNRVTAKPRAAVRAHCTGGNRTVRAVYRIDFGIEIIIDDIPGRSDQCHNKKEEQGLGNDRSGIDQVRDDGSKTGNQRIHRAGDGKKTCKPH